MTVYHLLLDDQGVNHEEKDDGDGSERDSFSLLPSDQEYIRGGELCRLQ